MISMSNNGSWSEYEKLVLAELKRLDENQQCMDKKLDKVLGMQESVESLKTWKVDVDKDIDSLKGFRTVVYTIGTAVQIAWFTLLALKDKVGL